MPARAYLSLAMYVLCSAIVVGLVVAGIVANHDDARNALLNFIFPEDWQWAVEALINRYMQQKKQVLVVNTAVGIGLLSMTVLLFPLKEYVSTKFEREAKLTDDPIEELPLWEQGWQEVKLLLLFIAVQGTLFAIGYFPSRTLGVMVIVLSHLWLFFSLAIDFISPLLQRHGARYSQILKLLIRRPLMSLTFGAIFAMPVLLAAHLYKANPEWGLGFSLSVIATLNVVAVAWAVVAGTWLASQIYEEYRSIKRSHVVTRVVFSTICVALLAGNAVVYGIVGNSIYHKTQALKCRYEVDWSSFEVDVPSLATTILAQEVKLGLNFDVMIENPTKVDVELEDTRIEVTFKDKKVTTAYLDPIKAPAKEVVRQRVSLSQELSPEFIDSFDSLGSVRSLLDRKQWKVTLYIKVSDYFEFPVFLVHPDKLG